LTLFFLLLLLPLLCAALLSTLLTLFLLDLFWGHWDLNTDLLLEVDEDWVVDELGVLLHGLLDLVLAEELFGVLLQEESDACTSWLDGVSAWVLHDLEVSSGVGCPDVLVVIIILTGDHNFLGNQKGGVETHTELTDQVNAVTLSNSFDELCGT
jgi:hypothetical protein